MATVLVLTDRPLHEALPAGLTLPHDVKVEPCDGVTPQHVRALAPAAVVVDAVPDPARGVRVLRELAPLRGRAGLVALIEARDLERHAWPELVDDFVTSDVSAVELRVRLATLAQRVGDAEATLRLGPLAVDTDTYQARIAGRALDLTFKEFELLRFLVAAPGRVFTRHDLLRQVWGYDFYGGTRTVDVHVRRLRAKLGEHGSLIRTIRGVGYAAADGTGR